MTFKSNDISKRRLHAQQLIKSSIKTASELVAWFGAVQGQEYAQTKWGLGLRLPQVLDADVERELTEGKILRTHLLRPTWHFVAASDIHWMLELTAPRVNAANAYMYRKMELEDKIFNRCNDIVVKLLTGNKQLTRDEINLEFKKHKIEAEGHRLSYIMMRSELEGLICSGAKRGNQFTYALIEERTSTPKIGFHRDEALAELTKRYFSSRGPASIPDFSTWSGLTMTDCKKGVQLLDTNMEEIMVDEISYYACPLKKSDKENTERLHLLPIYDEYIMGYKDREAMMEYRSSIIPANLFSYDCMIIFEGQIIGTWKRTVGKKEIKIQYNTFNPLTKLQQRLFEDELKRYEEFNGMMIVVSS